MRQKADVGALRQLEKELFWYRRLEPNENRSSKMARNKQRGKKTKAAKSLYTSRGPKPRTLVEAKGK
jgi:hypothetical protein